MSGVMAMGIWEAVIVLGLMGGGVGLPLGIPPAAEDPMMSRIAPDECLYYGAWSGVTKPDPKSQNRTELLLAEPEVQAFVSYVNQSLKDASQRWAATQQDGVEQLLAENIHQLSIALITKPSAIFVSKFEMAGGPAPQVEAGWVAGLGDDAQDVINLVKQIQDASGLPAEQVEIDGTSFQVMQPAPGMTLTIGVKDGYLMIGVGEGAIQGILARAKTPAPEWLTTLKKELPVERQSTISYVNGRALVEKVGQLAPPPTREVLAATGIDQFEAFQAVTGLDGHSFLSRMRVDIEDGNQGIFRAIGNEPLKREHLANIPQDVTFAAVARIDINKLIDESVAAAKRVDPQFGEQLEQNLEMTQQMLGFDVRKDMIAALGDVWQLYTSPMDGGITMGWTLSVDVKDAAALKKAEAQFVAFLAAMAAESFTPFEVKESTFNDQTIKYASFGNGFPLAPAWCVTNDRLVVGIMPQTIKAYLSLQDGDFASILDLPDVKPFFEDGRQPFSFRYVNTKELFSWLYPYGQMMMGLAAGQAGEATGMDIDITKLPTMRSIAKHLTSSVSAVYKQDGDYLVETRQSLPGGSLGATAPITVALLLPAVQSAREAARRAQSSNNLRQLAIAMHNYHDVYRGFPAAYSVSPAEKPLLSWRVHILPFIEQEALYREFKLDEPWDSEHNRKLIARMPEVYRSPNSNAAPGKTVYLAIRRDDSVMRAPDGFKQGAPTGTLIRDIRDGTSNTIIAVEANDLSSVIWTKPDDLVIDDENPLAGMMGVRPNVFLAMFADGSVRNISLAVDPEMLKALFTRSGAEVIDQDAFNEF